jgi:hypothetical protein
MEQEFSVALPISATASLKSTKILQTRKTQGAEVGEGRATAFIIYP